MVGLESDKNYNFFVQISFDVRQAHMYVFLNEIFQVHFHFVLHRLTKAHNRYISSRYLARKNAVFEDYNL